MVSPGAAAVANSARRYRFWHRRSADDLRSDWREVLDLPGRKDSRARQARNDHHHGIRKQATDYVDAEKGKVPQAAARPAQRKGVARRRACVWRVWTEGARAGVDYRPPD